MMRGNDRHRCMMDQGEENGFSVFIVWVVSSFKKMIIYVFMFQLRLLF